MYSWLLFCHKGKEKYLMGKYVFERHFDGDDQKNVILAPLIDFHDPCITVSMEPNMRSGSFNNA